jgi:uncharacterized coiled-coil protein SlyX
MTEKLKTQMDRLEILYTEQDYTIQALNDTVARQEQQISRLNVSIEQLRVQLQALKTDLPTDIDPVVEKPPHY